MKHYSDEELVDLLKLNDVEAFEEIYDRYWKNLYYHVVKKIGSQEDAQDIVQDLFISLWKKKDELTIIYSLSSYLYTAVKYRVINYLDSKKVRTLFASSYKKNPLLVDNSNYEHILLNDLESRLKSLIDTMSPKLKEIFYLSRKEHLSVREIAEKLHLSDQTVKNQISKAIKLIKTHLSDITTMGVVLLQIFAL